MTAVKIGVLSLTALGVCAILAAPNTPKVDSTAPNVDKAIHWLVSVQGQDGGWGQDGGETSFVRTAERLESNGNDVANTAVATLALVHAGSTPVKGEYRSQVKRGVDFILRSVEDSPAEGLAVTRITGTQIQRKLGPFIDTFLTSTLLSELDGAMGDTQSNQRVRRALDKVVRKIEANQQQDGSWNISGGWAPILGTSMASRSLDMARQKGVRVDTGEAGQGRRIHQAGAGEQSSRSVGGRGALPGRPSPRAVEPHRRRPQEERARNSSRDRAACRREIRERLRIDGRRGVFLLSQHQRQPPAHRRRRME